MTIGPTLSENQVNNQISTIAVALRDACQNASNFQQWIVEQGTAGLEAIGFSPADAASLLQTASYLNTIAAIYFGTAAQPSDFNFANATCSVWAGQ
jgi:hypothetical protein